MSIESAWTLDGAKISAQCHGDCARAMYSIEHPTASPETLTAVWDAAATRAGLTTGTTDVDPQADAWVTAHWPAIVRDA